MRVSRLIAVAVGMAALAATTGCHEEVKPVPLISRTIGIADRFFDVQALNADKAVVVGYGGKILLTDDGGVSWTQAPSGTRRALYRVHFVDANNGWVSGQDGMVLHTADGGKTWEHQTTGANVYLFSVYFADANHGWAVGDKSIFVHTTDGGAHWTLHKIIPPMQKKESAEEAVLSQDPILYDVQFLDPNVGWVVGEFGKIYHTTDGGATWSEQETSLLGAEVVDLLDLPTFFGVHFIDAQNGITAGLDGKLARTHDGGTSWKFEKMQLDYPVVDPFFYPYLFSDGTGYAVGAAGEVVKLDTPDGAWHRIKLGMEVLTWMRGMAWLDHNNGWIVGGLGLILHTTDGGKSWVPSLG